MKLGRMIELKQSSLCGGVQMNKAKIVLATPPTISHRTAEETLALEYLAAALRNAGYATVILDAWLRGIDCHETVNLIFENGCPSVICMSCYRSNLNQAGEIIKLAKARSENVLTVCGGYGPTFHDVEFLEAGFDVVVRGEAETVITDLIARILSGDSLSGVPGVSFVKNGKVVRTERGKPVIDLDSIRFPERDEMPFIAQRKNPVHICTSRGCNGNCSFCSVAAFNHGVIRKRWRGRSISNIVEEIRDIQKRFGTTYFKVVDDSFIEPPRGESWAKDFSDAVKMAGLNIRFRTQVRADRLTGSIVESLASCGWFATSVGVENFSDSALCRMRKPSRSADNLMALELLRKHNVYAQIGLIMFDNMTTVEELSENYQALIKYPWVIIKGVFTEMFASEGTAFTEGLKGAHLLIGGGVNQNYGYAIQDVRARRVYAMLKTWHKSHASLYDQVIDPLTAPKIMSEGGYRETHQLCTNLLVLDVDFFGKTLLHVAENLSDDAEMTESEIRLATGAYGSIGEKINNVYTREGLTYDGEFNPFLV